MQQMPEENKLYGLIGYPLGHSFSKSYFSEKFLQEHIAHCVYELFPLREIEQFPFWWQSQAGLCGFNVTTPHKQSILPYLDKLSEEAQRIGAVNCVRIKNRQLHGYNTDAGAFGDSLDSFVPEQEAMQALILGNGGSSQAIQYILAKKGISGFVVSRKGKGSMSAQGFRILGYEELNEKHFQQHRLIINCTNCGMSPHTDEMPPIETDWIQAGHYLYELIYNPDETKLASQARKRGARIKNGLEMLHRQAEMSWAIWNSEDE